MGKAGHTYVNSDGAKKKKIENVKENKWKFIYLIVSSMKVKKKKSKKR